MPNNPYLSKGIIFCKPLKNFHVYSKTLLLPKMQNLALVVEWNHFTWQMKELNLDVHRIMQLLKDAGEKTEHCVTPHTQNGSVSSLATAAL